MTQRRYIDRHLHFACEQCGDWTRIEFLEVVDCSTGAREMCPGCAEKLAQEERDEAAEDWWNSRNWEDRI